MCWVLSPTEEVAKDATASIQKVSQEHREKKLVSREYVRREVTVMEKLNQWSIIRRVTESGRVEVKSINQEINIMETDFSIRTTKKCL